MLPYSEVNIIGYSTLRREKVVNYRNGRRVSFHIISSINYAMRREL